VATGQRGALEWARRIEEWRCSGLSLPAFCRQRGLKSTTMCGWVYKPALKRAIEKARLEAGPHAEPVKIAKPSTPQPTPAFVPVRLRQRIAPPTSEPAPRSAIKVIVGAGRRVVVERGFDEVRGGRPPQGRGSEPLRDRAAAWDRPDLGAMHPPNRGLTGPHGYQAAHRVESVDDRTLTSEVQCWLAITPRWPRSRTMTTNVSVSSTTLDRR
jgi:hypothetical protein